MEDFTKQAFEAFHIKARFYKNMISGEKVSTVTVSATNKNGKDVTSSVLGDVTKGVQDAIVFVQNGEEAYSPYKITFLVETSLSHKWEFDVIMNIKEI